MPTALLLLLHITLFKASCSCSSPKDLSTRRTGMLVAMATGVDHSTWEEAMDSSMMIRSDGSASQ